MSVVEQPGRLLLARPGVQATEGPQLRPGVGRALQLQGQFAARVGVEHPPLQVERQWAQRGGDLGRQHDPAAGYAQAQPICSDGVQHHAGGLAQRRPVPEAEARARRTVSSAWPSEPARTGPTRCPDRESLRKSGGGLGRRSRRDFVVVSGLCYTGTHRHLACHCRLEGREPRVPAPDSRYGAEPRVECAWLARTTESQHAFVQRRPPARSSHSRRHRDASRRPRKRSAQRVSATGSAVSCWEAPALTRRRVQAASRGFPVRHGSPPSISTQHRPAGCAGWNMSPDRRGGGPRQSGQHGFGSSLHGFTSR